MSSKTSRLVAMATGLAVMCGVLGAADAASAEFTLPIHNWPVYGSLTAKKLNEPVVLPKGSNLNGQATFSEFGEESVKGVLKGALTIPPFKAKLKSTGETIEVGIKITQVGEAEGAIIQVPLADCPNSWVGFACLEVTAPSKANLQLTAAGVLGIEVPTNCETTEPILLPLIGHLTSAEVLSEAHFTGVATIPTIQCEGLQGIALGALLTTLMSGPENPFKIGLASSEPGTPAIEGAGPSRVSQVSAQLHGSAIPNGEPITDCHFEIGTSTSYTTSIPCTPQPRKAQIYQDAPGIALATGLERGKTYHYRLTATNSFGVKDGPDTTFNTLGAGPEFGHCVKQKKTGQYKDAGCGTKPKKVGKGSFEWHPGPAPTCFAMAKGEYTDSGCTMKSKKAKKGSFEKQAGPKFTSSSGAVTLEVGTRKVTCAASTGQGEVTSASAGVERISFTGCESSGKKCTSEGSNSTPSGSAGTIDTNGLDTPLLGPVEGQVWTELVSAEHQPYLAEFGCEGTLVRIKGSLSGVQGGNVGGASATGTTTFNATEGEQGLVGEVSENGGSSWAAGGATNAALTLTSTFELATEIRP